MQIPHHWRLREQRYNLTGTICTRCGKVAFSPRPVCPECSQPVEAAELFATRRTAPRPVAIMEPAQR
ncbi:MAG TPA: zinc ribbon domain-containing protein [Aggregatilineales bacterium]|jgi:uncharacterized OB-fold protein|nr:hypothetical protein [Chloroflexota bacterium]HOA22501.1 zinc ribbon domain-containing protein [Aggregatilineales bacterium]HPV07289.1 zinc ribbon domain-containing protein [Aggregatilineales bacterium]HQA67479.1 zinc ribbon domain-containing protein [Aggregatilineales bacterium]HQE17237.1 zinc ribbon domain-containing protein [Aggregatilineales bacterium]